MRTIFILILMCIALSSSSQNTTSIEKQYPLTYNAIRTRAVIIWVSLYDEQLQEIDKQCNAVAEFLDITARCSDTLQDVYIEAKTKAFNRYAERDWQSCDDAELDNWMACVNPDWARVVIKMKKKIYGSNK